MEEVLVAMSELYPWLRGNTEYAIHNRRGVWVEVCEYWNAKRSAAAATER